MTYKASRFARVEDHPDGKISLVIGWRPEDSLVSLGDFRGHERTQAVADAINTAVSRLVEKERKDAAVKALEMAAKLAYNNVPEPKGEFPGEPEIMEWQAGGEIAEKIRALADRVRKGEEKSQ